jgi:hypothetical protein
MLKCDGKWGNCCGIDGRCGTGKSFCGLGECQSGNCTVVIPSTPPFPGASRTTTPPVSTPTPGGTSPDGSWGGINKYQCKGSPFRDCCSLSGFCGSATGHCQAGCQTSFGNCTNPSLSPNGTCGGTNKDSGFGDCYDASSYCGSLTAHCTAGCQTAFGSCTTTDLSPDGTCGGTNKYKCKEFGFGDCCSSSGYCGSTTGHCTAGFQRAFGTCTSTNISPDGICGGSKGYVCKHSSLGDLLRHVRLLQIDNCTLYRQLPKRFWDMYFY